MSVRVNCSLAVPSIRRMTLEPSGITLRPLVVNTRRLPAVMPLLVALLLSACGTKAASNVTSNATSNDGHRERLLAMADEAAHGNGGEAKVVVVVRTTRREAERLSGLSSNQPNVPVWVVEVSGSDYTCGACSPPAGASEPTGRYLTLVPTTDTYKPTSFGIHPKHQDLASLGTVEVLRESD
jgi:hypothetical protein